MSPGAANLFPFFSEENNPLYLDPSERAANEAVQGNRDTAKRTKREVKTLTLTLPLAPNRARCPPRRQSRTHAHHTSPARAGARRGDHLPYAALCLLVRALPLRMPHHQPGLHREADRGGGRASMLKVPSL